VTVFKKENLHISCLFMEVRDIYNNLVWLGCLGTEGRIV
jgi:hypothetical protein